MDKPQTLKGFRDFLPDDARKRAHVITQLRSVGELFGFEPLETPSLEYAHVLTGKYGDEADKLIYTFLDRGGRKVGMRYDQTVPLARVVAQYQHLLPFPFKRYQIQPVWRAENTQKGRFREFVQCDIDTIGSSSLLADAEILAVATRVYEILGFPLSDIVIKINNRKNFSGIPTDAIITIDKLDKIGPEGVKAELTAKGHPTSFLDELQQKPIDEETLTIIEEYYPQLIGTASNHIVYTPTLARGLDYYTGSIYEVTIKDYSGGSVGGGGRYDSLIGTFAGRDIPAVGFAFGFDRILEAMTERELFPATLLCTKVLVTLSTPDHECITESLKLTTRLRGEGIATEVWQDAQVKIEKQLKYADQKNIPYVVILGPQERAEGVMILKNLRQREQQKLSPEEVIETLLSDKS